MPKYIRPQISALCTYIWSGCLSKIIRASLDKTVLDSLLEKTANDIFTIGGGITSVIPHSTKLKIPRESLRWMRGLEWVLINPLGYQWEIYFSILPKRVFLGDNFATMWMVSLEVYSQTCNLSSLVFLFFFLWIDIFIVRKNSELRIISRFSIKINFLRGTNIWVRNLAIPLTLSTEKLLVGIFYCRYVAIIATSRIGLVTHRRIIPIFIKTSLRHNSQILTLQILEKTTNIPPDPMMPSHSPLWIISNSVDVEQAYNAIRQVLFI